MKKVRQLVEGCMKPNFFRVWLKHINNDLPLVVELQQNLESAQRKT